MKWKCTVCGYIHEGVMPPKKCPICGVGPEKFVPVPESPDNNLPKEKYDALQALLFNVSYGLYIITALDGDKRNGMISNSFIQVTSDPLRGSVCINKDTLTGKFIEKSMKFGVNVLAQTNHDLVPRFGFQTGKTADKFAGLTCVEGKDDWCPAIPETLCFMEFEVEKIIDLGTHNMFIGKMVDGEAFKQGEPMTYAYYRATR